jgi:uncharacterized protein
MVIGVLSDTHDRLPLIDRALELFTERGVEAILHPGDLVSPFAAKRFTGLRVPFHVTYGNNDGERKGLKGLLPQIQDGPMVLDLDGRKILLHHFVGWCRPEDLDRAKVVVTGHTHEVVNEIRDGKLYLNPGECCGWVNNRCTVAILDTAGLSAEIIELQP